MATALAERTSSPSPSRRISLSSKISALGAKLGRTLTHGADGGEENDSIAPIYSRTERSTSRGRDAFQSTGRGGLGNIRQASLSRDRPETGPDDFSVTRGREPIAHPNEVFSTGRGGAGNIRSPSRDPSKPSAPVDSTEQDVIEKYVASQEGAARSSGRGGLGNIARSRSRDPTSQGTTATTGTAAVFSTGRGGAGNIHAGHSVAEEIDEDERRKYSTTTAAHEGVHSTGRGGAANITAAHEPAIEKPVHGQYGGGEYESTGRGGAGNIFKDRSKSRTRGD
ncbi:unnamed protein product [Cyclocybe aegerita]|uniref:Uncharacterized protein n=1 Tax=Cyclocybe aegerita TaxID=1973307 RepID=A0A8S0VTH1_CYCAE|nr:unnamed protein product [Cyclocybe aegerita]